MTPEGPSEKKSTHELRMERHIFSKDMEQAASQLGQGYTKEEATKASAAIEDRVRELIQEQGIKIAKDDFESIISCEKVEDGLIVHTLTRDYLVDKYDDVHVLDKNGKTFSLPPDESVDFIARFHPQELSDIWTQVFKEISDVTRK